MTTYTQLNVFQIIFQTGEKCLYDARILLSESGNNGNHRTWIKATYINRHKHLWNGDIIEIIQALPYLVFHAAHGYFWTIAFSH